MKKTAIILLILLFALPAFAFPPSPPGPPISVSSGKTPSFLNSITISGTDGSTINVGTGGTLGTAAFTAATSYGDVTGPASPAANNLVKFTGTGKGTDNAGVILGTMTNGKYCTYTAAGTLLSCNADVATSSPWTISKTITNPSAADDFVIEYVAAARTLTGVKIFCTGGTSATFTLQQCDNDGTGNCAALMDELTVTVATGVGTANVTDTSVAADKWLKMLTGTVTGAVTSCTWTAYGTTP